MKKMTATVSLPLFAAGMTVCALGALSAGKDGTGHNPAASPKGIQSITTLVDGRVKSADWSPVNDTIAFGRWGRDGYVDIWLMDPDGTDQRLLTGPSSGLPQKHNGNPAWHPSGRFIVLTAEKPDNPDRFSPKAIPGTGINCDLWAVTADGKKSFRLTDHPLRPPFRAVIHPHLSPEGRRLLWAERVGRSRGFSWGEWALKIADFITEGDSARLENIRTYQPGRNRYFYEGHSFSPDGGRILFSGNPDGQNDAGFDIYELDLKSGRAVNLTGTPAAWDEHAHYSPDGKKIAWMSSAGLDVEIPEIEDGAWKKKLASELWMMNVDGSGKERLTFFNQAGSPEYIPGRVIVSDLTFSPDGSRILALVAYETPGSGRMRSRLVMIGLIPKAV